jgi:gamma-glutamyl-gamma-aminobutyrate hydrolase PuuD
MGIYGIKHGNYHEITHVKRSNLGFFNVVNSLHHQGIRILGQRRRENYENTKGVAIATDLTHDVVEIATWLDDKILALQFHPEYYDDNNEDKIKLRQFIYDWVKGKTTILTK